jgi:hypothetical protein
MKNIKQLLAEHFGATPEEFEYVRPSRISARRPDPSGWYYKPANKGGDSFLIGESIHDIQSSPCWVLKKLVGRDTF